MSPSLPEPAAAAAAQLPPTADVPTPDEVPEDAEQPTETLLNRAERRAKNKGTDPSHVGPRAGRTTQGRSARSHTKRQIS